MLFELAAGAGAVGVPVKEGELMFAFKATSELNDVILAVFVAMLVLAEVILAVLVTTEFVKEVMLAVFVEILAFALVMLEVFDAIKFVFVVKLAVLVATVLYKAVILFVLAVILVGKVAIVAELTPPTLFTTGAVAVPPKSFVNCNIPFVEASASGVTVLLAIKAALTKAVVAI